MAADRRKNDRRRIQRAEILEERRSTLERRRWKTPDRALLEMTDLQPGWLCFDCGEEKRRLAPIPFDWETCSQARLNEILNSAALVVRACDTP